MKCLLPILLLLTIHGQLSAQQTDTSFIDTVFFQEYHEPFPLGSAQKSGYVKSITVDRDNTVWIATPSGIMMKRAKDSSWMPVDLPGADGGPAYAVASDEQGIIWMGAWNGVYIFSGGKAQLVKETNGPIPVLCASPDGIYTLGPRGVWQWDGKQLQNKKWTIARSIRAAISDGAQGIWVASEVGLYHCTGAQVSHYSDTQSVISASLKGLAFASPKELWVAGLGGVSVVQDGRLLRTVTPAQGSPSIYNTSVKKSPDGSMWVGTKNGLIRFAPDGTHSLRFSRRWLLDDQVNDICFDNEGNAWIATPKGVSAIKKKKMTLAAKQDYFYDVLMRRHIRKPWISGQCRLTIAGDTSSWQPEDDDNDGEYGGNYLTMECFRYAVTKSEDAKRKAGKAFAFLRQLREITGGDGYFARTIVPADWNEKVHDGNRAYTEMEKANELVNDSRFKPVETRWHKSADGQWLWKGDASSDEWCGHMMGYFFYYQLVANEAEKKEVRKHVIALVDHLIAHEFNMMDVDGTHTRWSVWSPALLNGDPEWAPDQSENSMELLAFLKLAYFMTGNEKYQQHYLKMINEYHYLDNMSRLTAQNPAWFVYYDVIMQCYLYPILITCEKDPKLKAWYEAHMDNWMKQRVGDHNPQINFLYCLARNKKIELDHSISFLTDTPLDLVSWPIDHTHREDIRIVHSHDISEFEVSELPPASIRATVRWDANPWLAMSGNPEVEREPVFWLLPYWLGRYVGMIR